MVALVVGASTALAVHDPAGPIELDGNIANGAAAGTDWAAMFDASGAPIAANLPTGTLAVTRVIQDFVPGATGPDPSYHEPSNKDDQQVDPNATDAVWGCVSVANATDKTDIVNAYALAIQGDGPVGDADGDDAGDILFYYGVERFDNSGDAFIGTWLFQGDVTCNTTTGKFEGQKTTGDILILTNFTNGGGTATVQAFRYIAGATRSAPGTFQLIAGSSKCETTPLGTPDANNLCASVNTANVVTPWAMEDKEKSGPPSPDVAKTIEPNQFFEGGINLTDAFQAAGVPVPACFGSFMAETRSSSSLDATLKDYSLGDFDTCDLRVKIDPSATNRVGEPHTFTVTVEKTSGAGFSPATVGNVDVTLTGSNGIGQGDITIDAAASTCDDAQPSGDNLNDSGQCTIKFVSSKTGLVTGNATASVDLGGTIRVRDTNPTTSNIPAGPGGSGPAVKKFVDARITINPSATNRVNEAHTFTVKVEKDLGNGAGFVAAAGEDVNFALTGALGIGAADIQLNAADSTCDDAGANTNASGECTIVFTSPKTGTVTGSASSSVTIDTEVMPVATDGTARNGNVAIKKFVDAKITINPSATNRVGEAHVFNVKVQKDLGNGGGFVNAAGEDVNFTLTGALGIAAGDIQLDAAASTCDDAGANTDANGECTIQFVSNKTGTVTGSASATVTIDTEIIPLVTDGSARNGNVAVKKFVDAKISIAANDTNSIEESHTFTVTVQKDLGNGSGFVAAAGEDVDFTLTNTLGANYVLNAAASTCDDAGANTNASGQCTIVFTSATAGTVTGNASATVTIDTEVMPLQTNSSARNSGPAVKVFVDGSLRWLKQDDDGNALGGATFEVCRTHRLNSGTGAQVLDPGTEAERCFTVFDAANGTATAPDVDADPGEIQVNDLVLGRYTVEETIPPAGFHIGTDPGAGPFTFPDMTIATPDVQLVEIFVNLKAFRLIVITCDDITDQLVISSVNLDGSVKDTLSTTTLAAFNTATGQDLTEAQICGIGGASYGDLPDDTYTPTVILPKPTQGLSAS